MEQDQRPPQEIDDLAQDDARAFLDANELASDAKDTTATNESSQPRQPVLLYVVAALVVAVVVTLLFIHPTQPKNTAGGSNSSGGLLTAPTPDSAATKDLPGDAQQEINSCSNTLNAVAGKC